MVDYELHQNDLPDGIFFGDILAIDNEMMGLNLFRDRLCLCQIYDGLPNSKVHMVQFDGTDYSAPNLRALLSDITKIKLLYFARGDMGWIGHYLGVVMENVYCTKIVSRIARTYRQDHELETQCREILGIKMPKEQQCSNWAAPILDPEQLKYAVNDVLHLHALREALDLLLKQNDRQKLAYDILSCLPARVQLDLAGWHQDQDIFAYMPTATVQAT